MVVCLMTSIYFRHVLSIMLAPLGSASVFMSYLEWRNPFDYIILIFGQVAKTSELSLGRQ